MEIFMATIPQSETPLPPAPLPTRFLTSIKGIGQISPGPGDDQGTTNLSGSRIHLGLTTTCRRLELSSLRPWDGSREQLLDLVASALWCSDATMILDVRDPSPGSSLGGWTANFEIVVTDPRLSLEVLRSIMGWAGLVNSLEDWNPSFGRFAVVDLVASASPAG
jgi:hypothetical protein